MVFGDKQFYLAEYYCPGATYLNMKHIGLYFNLNEAKSEDM